METKEQELHPIYKALFWCSERKDFFRWNDFINGNKDSEEKVDENFDAQQ